MLSLQDRVESSATSSDSLTRLFFIGLSISYIFMFEWRFFAESHLTYIVNLLKFCIPIILFMLGINNRGVFNSFFYLRVYVILFFLFLLWGLFPSIFSDIPTETVLQWSKFGARFIFFLAIILFLFKDKKTVMLLCKMLVYVGCLTTLQYFLTSIFPDNYVINFFGVKPVTFWVPEIATNVGRLQGFWFEPSNASGYLFSAYFISKALHSYSSRKRFYWMSYICLLGGFFCFSNAGYLCLGGATLFGVSARKKIFSQRVIINIIIIVISIIFIVIGLFGRQFYVNNNMNSGYLKLLVGVRNVQMENDLSRASYDPFSGRVEWTQQNLAIVAEHPFGIGFRIPGERDDGQGLHIASASAIVLWLTYAGIPGVVILLLMQGFLIYFIFKTRISVYQIRLAQAWIAVILQNLSYGTWFTPFYFVLVALIFSGSDLFFREKILSLSKKNMD